MLIEKVDSKKVAGQYPGIHDVVSKKSYQNALTGVKKLNSIHSFPVIAISFPGRRVEKLPTKRGSA